MANMEVVYQLFSEVDNLEQSREYSRALTKLNEIVKRIDMENLEMDDEFSYLLYYKRGVIREKFKKYKIALEDFVKAKHVATRDEEIALLHVREGICFVNMQIHDKADESFEKAAILYYNLAKKDLRKDYYIRAITHLSISERMYQFSHNSDGVKKVSSKLIDVNLAYFRDLAVVSNYYNYNDEHELAKSTAWRALQQSLNIIKRASKTEGRNDLHSVQSIVNTISNSIPYCRNALERIEDEYSSVVRLKLDELDTFFGYLSDDIPDDPDDVQLWIATHEVALEYLYPTISPAFYVLNKDGLLIYHSQGKKDIDIIDKDKVGAGLFAGLISALRLVFNESFSPLEGDINVVNVDGGKLIFETTEEFVVVCAVSYSYPELTEFLKDLAAELSNKFGSIIAKWKGIVKEFDELNKYCDTRINNFLGYDL